MSNDRPGAPPPKLPGTETGTTPAPPSHGNDRCEVCGSERLSWRNCKLICANCRSIVKSCADL